MERNNHGAAEERQRPLTNEDQRRLITKEELQAIMTLPGMELQKKAPEKPKEPEKPEKPKEPERPEEPEKPMPVGLDSLHGSGSCPQLKSSDGFGSCPHQILGSCPPQNLGLLQLQSSEVAYELKSSEVSRLSTGMKLHVGPRLSTGMKPRRKMAVGLHRKRKGRRYRAGESSEDAIYKDYLDEQDTEVGSSEGDAFYEDDLDEQHTEVESSEVNWLLCKMIHGKDWKGVEDLIGHHPEALTVNISDSKTIFHHIVNFTGDDIEAAREIDKLASKLNNPITLEQKDSRGLTVLHLSAITGMKSASETLVKYHGNLPNAWSADVWLPVHHAAYYGKKDTVQYLVSVTAKKNLVDINGARLISYLINSNLYDVALDILKENPAIGRDHIRSRKMVLKTLAGKPLAFKTGTRLGRLQCFIYKWIPVKKEKVSSMDQTNKNRSADVDVENGISKTYSTNSTSFGFLPKITTFFGAMSQDLHIMFWNALILLFPCIKAIHDKKLTHLQSVEIFTMICEGVAWKDPEIFKENDKDMFKPWLFLHTAARFGISEFVKLIIMTYKDSLYRTNSEGHHIFHHAVLHRQENIFNLIHRFRYLSDMLNMYDKSGNNMLHLAGRLVPSSKVAGAALQMQRELQWFKAVEDLLPQWHQEEKNSKNLTPRELFAESHKELVKEGEKWMKDTAQSCTIAATLIITVVFAAAFTVPGGNNDRGQPIFLKEKYFLIFAISDALAFFSSTTSLLMFLGILTSRYSENDFLVSLPRKLIIGLITLFFSIASMIVAFGGTIHIVLSQPWKWVIIPIALLGCVPVTLFALLQFRLLFDMFYYTYGPSIFHPVNLTLKCVSN